MSRLIDFIDGRAERRGALLNVIGRRGGADRQTHISGFDSSARRRCAERDGGKAKLTGRSQAACEAESMLGAAQIDSTNMDKGKVCQHAHMLMCLSQQVNRLITEVGDNDSTHDINTSDDYFTKQDTKMKQQAPPSL